jgi:hypothetical protein
MVVVVVGDHDFPIMDSILKWLATENRGDRSKEREVFALGAPEREEIAPGDPIGSGRLLHLEIDLAGRDRPCMELSIPQVPHDLVDLS